MAGAKETPRQKMIGMMYLVLTALLALNVSNTVLEKFLFMNRTMEKTVDDGESKNNGTVGRIEAQVEESGKRAKDIAVLKTAQEVRTETTKVLSELDELKKMLIKETGDYEEDGITPKGIKNMEKIAQLMIKKKEGKKLQDLLNGYTSFLALKLVRNMKIWPLMVKTTLFSRKIKMLEKGILRTFSLIRLRW